MQGLLTFEIRKHLITVGPRQRIQQVVKVNCLKWDKFWQAGILFFMSMFDIVWMPVVRTCSDRYIVNYAIDSTVLSLYFLYA